MRPTRSRTSIPFSFAKRSSSRYCRSRNIAESIPVLVRMWNPIFTFSSTVMNLKSWMFWKVRAIPSLAIFSGANPLMDSPRKNISPDVGLKMPEQILKKVVLPAPFGPMTPNISPTRICMFTFSTALRPPKYWQMSRASSNTLFISFLPRISCGRESGCVRSRVSNSRRRRVPAAGSTS